MSSGAAMRRHPVFPSDLPGPVANPAVPEMPVRLSLPTGEERELGFDGLRARGLEWLQALGGGVWTDHNLHDPGITLLEQLCFGLTDLVYRAGFPVADHLTGPDGTIDYAGLSLHPPAEVFPCRPTTPADYRRHLLDAVPGLDDAVRRLGTYDVTDGAAEPAVVASAVEFLLEGLHLARRLNKERVVGRSIYHR